jgi:peptidyl-prolyl cis-trans isomerase D
MADTPKTTQPTKKHLARMQRERMYRRYILIAFIAVIAVTAGILIYGMLQQSVLEPLQAVAIVNSEKISTKAWQAQTRFARSNLIRSALNTYQFAQAFSDPSFASSFASQLQQIQFQLDPATVGKQTLDQMVDNIVIRDEAEKLGVSVTDEEINNAFQEAFGYYPEGTPTPVPTFPIIPTSTLSPLQMTLVPPTATPTLAPTLVVTGTVTATATLAPTATPTIEPTPEATSTPMPTATPYTLEGYQELFKQTVADYKTNYQISESDLRYVIETQLLRQKVEEAVVGELPNTRQEVWARHILVADEALAKDLYTQVSNGADFCKLAAENSTDDSNKDNCGDLGWFTAGKMVKEFEDVAFAMQPGDLSEPVKTEFGWHIIQVLGNEDRPIAESEYNQLKTTKFTEWLTELKKALTIEIKDIWQDRSPTTPVLPAEIEQYIQSASQTQQQNPLLQITPEP